MSEFRISEASENSTPWRRPAPFIYAFFPSAHPCIRPRRLTAPLPIFTAFISYFVRERLPRCSPRSYVIRPETFEPRRQSCSVHVFVNDIFPCSYMNTLLSVTSGQHAHRSPWILFIFCDSALAVHSAVHYACPSCRRTRTPLVPCLQHPINDRQTQQASGGGTNPFISFLFWPCRSLPAVLTRPHRTLSIFGHSQRFCISFCPAGRTQRTTDSWPLRDHRFDAPACPRPFVPHAGRKRSHSSCSTDDLACALLPSMHPPMDGS